MDRWSARRRRRASAAFEAEGLSHLDAVDLGGDHAEESTADRRAAYVVSAFRRTMTDVVSGFSRTLKNPVERDVEDERRVGRNRSASRAAVREIGRNHETALSADTHAWNAEVPAANDLAGAESERNIRIRVELCAFRIRSGRVVEPSGICDGNRIA